MNSIISTHVNIDSSNDKHITVKDPSLTDKATFDRCYDPLSVHVDLDALYGILAAETTYDWTTHSWVSYGVTKDEMLPKTSEADHSQPTYYTNGVVDDKNRTTVKS